QHCEPGGEHEGPCNRAPAEPRARAEAAARGAGAAASDRPDHPERKHGDQPCSGLGRVRNLEGDCDREPGLARDQACPERRLQRRARHAVGAQRRARPAPREELGDGRTEQHGGQEEAKETRDRQRSERIIAVSDAGGMSVTLLWFVVWFISDRIGDREVLTFDPVNWWAGFFLFAVAVDLS